MYYFGFQLYYYKTARYGTAKPTATKTSLCKTIISHGNKNVLFRNAHKALNAEKAKLADFSMTVLCQVGQILVLS